MGIGGGRESSGGVCSTRADNTERAITSANIRKLGDRKKDTKRIERQQERSPNCRFQWQFICPTLIENIFWLPPISWSNRNEIRIGKKTVTNLEGNFFFKLKISYYFSFISKITDRKREGMKKCWIMRVSLIYIFFFPAAFERMQIGFTKGVARGPSSRNQITQSVREQ